MGAAPGWGHWPSNRAPSPSSPPTTTSLLQFQQQPSYRKMSHAAFTKNENTLVVKAGEKLHKSKGVSPPICVRQGGIPWPMEHQRKTAKGVSQGQVCVFIQSKVSWLRHMSWGLWRLPLQIGWWRRGWQVGRAIEKLHKIRTVVPSMSCVWTN